MAVHYRTQGFVLKKDDLSEADQLLTLYTKNFGKLEVLGKAIRKIKSKLKPGAELFYLSEIEFIQGKTHKTLTDAITIDKFKNLRESPEKLEIAYQIADAADNLIRGEEKDDKVWDLLSEVFEKLTTKGCHSERSEESRGNSSGSFGLRPQDDRMLKIIYYYFLWNLLSILGYQIDLYNCAICQRKLTPQKLYFYPGEGLVCPNCLKEGKEEISPDIIKILRLFLKNDWQTLSRLKITNSHKKELESISESAIIHI